MQNWSGYLKWEPSQICYPSTESEIVEIIWNANEENKKVRIIGSGHSFTPLCRTDQFLISLDKYQGLISIDKEKMLATVKAGTKLNYMNELLAKNGLALPNLGDIDVQSIAGAISTGTHGTGINFGNISTDIRKIKLVNGLGEIVECSETDNKELFKAAQISLGVLGVLTEITFQCVPSYSLELTIQNQDLNQILDTYQDLNQKNRNFEFYWFPHSPYVMTKTSNLSNAAPDKSSFKDYVHEMLLENYTFHFAMELGYRIPSLSKKISRMAASTVNPYVKVNESHKVFSTIRTVRFNEMEYNVPAEAYLHVIKEIIKWFDKNNKDIIFPIENRFVKGDDIYLSPAFERESAYIAVHTYHKQDFKKYFTAMESIFKAHEGRPHWGKMHNLEADEFDVLYPKFNLFREIRNRQDPNGVFMSPYLEQILEM